MTTLTDIRRRMLQRGPADIGRVENIAALDADDVTVTKLGIGSYDANYLNGYFMIRPQAADAANRNPRVVDTFFPATGILRHTGTSYTDTTATNETVEIWKYDPDLVEQCIQIALERLRRSYQLTLPALNGSRMHFLHSLPAIVKPSDVMRIEGSSSRVLSNNRYFDEFFTVNSSGVLQPDFWTLSGGTMARSTTQTYRSKYALGITRAGSDITLTQNVGLVRNGVSGEDLAGRTVGACLVAWSTEASQIRVGINDGVTTTYSSYHTGADTWEELTVSKTLSAAATKCEVTISVESSNTVCYAGECYLAYEGIQDDDRRDSHTNWSVWDKEYSQSTSLPVWLPERGIGETFKVWISRSYPQFDSTRVMAGTADADETDAPVTTVAIGALAELYRRLSGNKEENTSQEARDAAMFEAEFQDLQASLLTLPDIEKGASPVQRPYVSLAGLRGL